MIALSREPIRFASYLAPRMLPVYSFIAEYVAHRLGHPTEIHTAEDYDRHHQFDVCFICGLAYIELARQPRPALRPVAAPVLAGERFGGRPVYYSDVIVKRDSGFRSFCDLRGRSWAYNEPYSQSGYGITCYCLARLGERRGYFGKLVEAGYHEHSIRLVASGQVDASAIDCHVLELALRDHPELRQQLRIVASLGPSTIQPVTVSRRLPEPMQQELQCVFVGMARDPDARARLGQGLIERFVAVGDDTYDDLRAMRSLCQSAGVLTL